MTLMTENIYRYSILSFIYLSLFNCHKFYFWFGVMLRRQDKTKQMHKLQVIILK